MKNGFIKYFSIFITVFLLFACNKKSKKEATGSVSKQQVIRNDTSAIKISTQKKDTNRHQVEQSLKSISTDTLPDIMSIEMPDTPDIVVHDAYIHSMEKVKYKGKKVLLIRGSLPNGCSKLYHVKKAIDGETLTLTIETWRPKHKVCTQALKPFTFIYDGLGYFEYKSVTHYKINGKTKAF